MKSYSPNDLGKKFLVEDCQRVSITACLEGAREKLKKALVSVEAELGGISVELVTSPAAFGGLRYWFKCPKCAKRAGMLFVHPLDTEIGCRRCLNLEYRSRRYKGMIENSIQKTIK